MIAIIDYDVGNVGAVANMLRRLAIPCEITADPAKVESARRIILPGNGAFDACMRNLRQTGLIPLIERRVLGDGVPLLGICVGAQMLGHGSEEGSEPGLGWIDHRVRRFPDLPGLRIPHMGWADVRAASDNPLVRDLDADARYYFVHSYYIEPGAGCEVMLTARYGVDFAAAVVKGAMAGVQFHPEKSHRFGMRLLRNFAEAG